MPMWDLDADWDFKVEKLARSLHICRELADDMLRDLERQRCYDDRCNGQMQVYGTKGVVTDADGDRHPRETFYECAECGTKWVYDFQVNRVTKLYDFE